MYINDNTQEIKSKAQIKADEGFSPPAGENPIIGGVYYFIYPTAKPTYNSDTEKVVSAAPIKTGEQYFEAWSIVQLTQPELDAVLLSAQTTRKGEIVVEVTDEIDSFYHSVDLTQSRVRDQITSLYNVYQRDPAPTPEMTDYMTEVDGVTDYTSVLFDSLDMAALDIMALTNPQDVRDYTYAMPPSGQISPIGDLANLIRVISMRDI